MNLSTGKARFGLRPVVKVRPQQQFCADLILYVGKEPLFRLVPGFVLSAYPPSKPFNLFIE